MLSLLLVAAVVPLVQITPGAAVGDSTFKGADGNLVKEASGTNTDWCNKTLAELSAQSAPNTNICPAGSLAPNLAVGIDLTSGNNDDAFSNGTKDDTNPPTLGSGGVPPNKDDLKRFYIANEKVNGDDYLYLAFERVSTNSSSAHEGFEFNQNKCVKTGTPPAPTADSLCSANGATPVRKKGDAFILYDFEGGSAVPVISVSRWITAAADGTCEVSSNSPPCWSQKVALDANEAEALTNNDSVGAVLDPINPGAPRTMQPNEFGEAAINLTEADLLPTEGCLGFGSAYVTSRSSGNSGSSVRKDFIAPIPISLNNCQPATITIKKVDQNGANLGGATIGLYNDQASGPNHGVFDAADTLATIAATSVSANPCLTTNTNPCSWTVTGTGTNHYLVKETVAPPGYTLITNPVHVDVTFNSSVQTINLTDMTNNPAPRDLKVKKIDDDDPANPVSGVVFRVVEDFADDSAFGAAERTAYAAVDVKTCTTGANGECTITGLATPKNYWVVEHSRPAGYGEDTGASNCTVSTGPDVVKKCRRINVPIDTTGAGAVGPVGATFTNPRLFKVVTFVCRKTDSTLYASETQYDGTALSGTNNTATNGNPAAITAAVQSAICGMTGGSVHDDANFGNHTSQVNIPK